MILYITLNLIKLSNITLAILQIRYKPGTLGAVKENISERVGTFLNWIKLFTY